MTAEYTKCTAGFPARKRRRNYQDSSNDLFLACCAFAGSSNRGIRSDLRNYRRLKGGMQQMTASRAGRASISLLLLGVAVGLYNAMAQQPQPVSNVSQTSPSTQPSTATSPEQPSIADVLRKLNDLSGQLQEAHRQIEELQTEVGQLRQQLSGIGENTASVTALNEAVDQIKNDQEITHTQIATLEQTKVRSYSRYPVTLTGLVLFNSYVVDGSVDNPALPIIALSRGTYYPHHSLGATFNQTQLGVNATGPTIWNARTAAQITADFFSNGYYMADLPNLMPPSTSKPAKSILIGRIHKLPLGWKHRWFLPSRQALLPPWRSLRSPGPETCGPGCRSSPSNRALTCHVEPG